VNNSFIFTNINGSEIYLGFVHIKDFENRLGKIIVKERQENGLFKSIQDFVSRTNIGREQMIILIRCGALRFSGKTKAELLWKAHMLISKKKEGDKNPKLMEEPQAKDYTLPEFKSDSVEDCYDEIELIGFPVTLSIFDLLKTSFRGEAFASNMNQFIGNKVRMVGRLVTIKYVRTVRKEIMNFAAFLDPGGEFFDTVHFPNTLRDYPFRGDGVYLLLGKIVEEFGFASMEVEKMAKLPLKPDPREV
jgi:DNA polymerase III alpha subunit